MQLRERERDVLEENVGTERASLDGGIVEDGEDGDISNRASSGLHSCERRFRKKRRAMSAKNRQRAKLGEEESKPIPATSGRLGVPRLCDLDMRKELEALA